MTSNTAETPIAITGMHRSGTSMITRVLHDSGLHLIGSGAEALIEAAEDNPEGFWENKAIVACNDELLEATGGAWDNPPDLPPQGLDDSRVVHVAEASTAAVAALSEHAHWGFKDPRTCLTARYWLDLVPDLRFIVCVRHPLEVALSLKRRNQNSYSLGLALWERYYASVLDQVPAERRIVTHYDTFFVDPGGEIARLCAFAGLEPAPPRIREDLRHHVIDVSLANAGASPTLRALYASLCREAGVAVMPDTPSDEGRVRRLILDGAVAQRHADQRQAAIERLEEREAELRAERTATEAELRQRIRELEQQVLRERAASETEHRNRVRDLEARHAARLEALQAQSTASVRALTEAVARTEAETAKIRPAIAEIAPVVAEIDTRTRKTAARVEVAIGMVAPGPLKRRARRSAGRAARGGRRFVITPGRRVLGRSRRTVQPAARSVFHRLPGGAQFQLRRARNLLQRGVKAPAPTAHAVGAKLSPKVAATAKRLPPPAQRQLRRGRSLYRRARTDPTATAKWLARRLPGPAQRALRSAWRATQDAPKPLLAPLAPRDEAPKPLPTPKGPALRHWKEAYEHMLAAALPSGSRWLVVTPGSPKEVRDSGDGRATPFPDTRRGGAFADDLAHIANLEALRCRGQRFLVLPEGSRAWFRQQFELRDHVVRTARTVVDEDGAGAVFDLAAPPLERARSLRSEVARLAAGAGDGPAVLDWTDLGVGRELPGLATFLPPAGDRLPYLDGSVDLVVVDTARDREEARRVASLGVCVVAAGASGIDVVDVDDFARTPAGPAHRIVVRSSAGPGDDAWRTHLGARAAAAGADLQLGEIDASGVAALGDHDIVVIVEPNALPLPGVIEAAAKAARARPDTVVTGKVIQADGRLESAGGIVFFDRSVALIAASSYDVRAPWHEFVRPVCWASGLVAASRALVDAVPGPGNLTGRAFVREWCARVWERGGSVLYQPEIASVRLAGDGREPSVPLRESAWQRVLDLRPNRPGELSDGAWRHLLAHDDVEACRG